MADDLDGAGSNPISRRDSLKLLALAGLVAGCGFRPLPETPPDTATPAGQAPVARATLIPTRTPLPTLPPAATPILGRPAAVRFYPDGPSRVVHARHSGAWRGEELAPDILRTMLDASIVALTGAADAESAWAALFDPKERIAIKVNTISTGRGQTHAPLVYAVTDRLLSIGVPAEQITIYDRTDAELKLAGFTVNSDGPGVRCHCPVEYRGGWRLVGQDVTLGNILLEADALINVPILKEHGQSGISFAMKNHFGTFLDHRQSVFHTLIQPALVELNGLPEIRDRTRLIVGDVLSVILGTNWDRVVPGDSILMSFDPVAHDSVGLKLFGEKVDHAGAEKRTPYLADAARVGLGTNDPAHIDLVPLDLG